MAGVGAGHDAGETGGVRYRYTADVEVADQAAQPCQPRVVVETKTGSEHLEADARADVGKGRTVEIEAQSIGRAIAPMRQPQEACLRIDKASDQPG